MEAILHPSICSPRNKPWEYKPKPNRFLVHSLCANLNEPKRTKGLLSTFTSYITGHLKNWAFAKGKFELPNWPAHPKPHPSRQLLYSMAAPLWNQRQRSLDTIRDTSTCPDMSDEQDLCRAKVLRKRFYNNCGKASSSSLCCLKVFS